MPRPVLTIGETMVLVTPASAERLETASEFRLETGGAESNVAIHLHHHGTPAHWLSRVGDDALGRRLLAQLGRRGVDTSAVAIDSDHPTGVYFKDPGHGVIYHRRGSAASHLSPADLDRIALTDFALVHLSGITPALSESAAELVDAVLTRCHSAGVPVSFDVNHRPQLWADGAAAPTLLALAERADIVLVGRDEAEALWGAATAADIRALLPGPRLLVKDGEIGAHEFAPGSAEDVFVATEPVEVVEAVGAGDAFAGAWLAAHLTGRAPTDSLLAGHRHAARVLQTTADQLDPEEIR